MPATTRMVGIGVSFSAVIIVSIALSVVALPQGSRNLTASRGLRLPRKPQRSPGRRSKQHMKAYFPQTREPVLLASDWGSID
jgi:hypothetical protein